MRGSAGGVLSNHFFAIYIDSVVQKVSDSKNGCYIKGICMSILLYADDILLVAPSVTALQRLLLLCEQELTWLDMSLNALEPDLRLNAVILSPAKGRYQYGLTTFEISASTLFQRLVFKCSRNVPSIGPSMPCLGKLVESLLMRLLYK